MMVIEKIFLAHIDKDSGKEQLLSAHLCGTADYAKAEGSTLGIGTISGVCAMLHDEGKYMWVWQVYIRQEKTQDTLDHSSAGAQTLMMLYGDQATGTMRLFFEMLAYTISAHHGLYDCMDEAGNDLCGARLQKELQESREQLLELWYLEMNYTKERLDEDMRQAMQEFAAAFLRPLWELQQAAYDESEKFFYISCMQRLLLSIQIDADWTDTACAMDGILEELHLNVIAPQAWKHYQTYMAELEKSKSGDTEAEQQIARLRREIRKNCMKFSFAPYGIYRLSLPTGAGKTLTGLGIALKLALERKEPEVSHIFYISPYISITEQNAAVIKDAVGNPDWVLEHHSNISAMDEAERQIDTAWKEPLICTTMMQFLYTLFSDKKKSIRRFHQLKNAVILVDEVQSLPIKTLYTFNLMMNFLSRICHATILLCTATQPEFAAGCIRRKLVYAQPRDLLPDTQELFMRFERTNVVYELGKQKTLEQLGTDVRKTLEQEDSIMVILNKKQTVADFYDLMKDTTDGIKLYYLTTNLCAEHRSARLKEIKTDLELQKEKVLIISTSLIEAGVDLSVRHVFRSLAGLDSIAQAAGRCNRNGEFEKGMVTVVELEGDAYSGILEAGLVTKEIMLSYQQQDQTESILSPAWMQLYYENYYQKMEPEMSYSLKGKHERGLSIYKLLTCGFSSEQSGAHMLQQAFATAGKKYRPIENDTASILVPYKDANQILEQLEQAESLSIKYKLLRRLQRYTVAVYEQKLQEYCRTGAIRECKFLPKVYVAATYDEEKGLTGELPLAYF